MMACKVLAFVLLSIAIGNTNGLQLAPVIIQTPASKKFDIPLTIGILPEITITQKLTQELNGFNLSPNMISLMGKEIASSVGIGNCDVYHLQWSFEIMCNVGTLKVFSGVAHINGGEIKYSAKSVALIQRIPALFNLEPRMVRTGGRRYGVFGPYRTGTRYFRVNRGPNTAELEQIANHLMAKLPEAQKLLN